MNLDMKIDLTNRSKLLLEHFDSLNKIINNNNNNNNNHNNTKKSIYNKTFYNLQKDIFNKLTNIYKNIKVDLCNIEKYRNICNSDSEDYKKIMKTNNTNHYLNSSRYIDNDIVNYINTNEKSSTLIGYNLPYNSKIIEINFVVYKSHKLDSMFLKKMDNYVMYMFAFIQLITLLTSNKDNKDNNCAREGLITFIYMTPFKKEITNQVLGARNVNTGFSYPCQNRGLIFIYRYEEFIKVFIHECMHTYGVDLELIIFQHSISNNNNSTNNRIGNTKNEKIYKKFIDNFNLSNEINHKYGKFDLGIQECLTEFWTNFLNCSLFTFNHINSMAANSATIFHKYLCKFERLFEAEILFSLNQCYKILNHNNINYLSILSKTDQKPSQNFNIESVENNYREESHIFSYYIIKTLLIYDYKRFLCGEYFSLKESLNNPSNNPSNNSINICFTKNYESFFDYIVEQANNVRLIKLFTFLKKIDNKLNLLNEDFMKKYNRFIYTNMRMCAIEITF